MVHRTGRTSPYRIFRNRTFTQLWLANLVSVSGSALTSLAGAILVYQLTGSALHVGLVLLAATIPALVVGLFAGVLIDRYDRKRIMIAADLVRAALVLAMPFVAAFGVGWLYLLVILAGVANQFFEPAHLSILPDIADEEELAAANALMEVSTQIAWALGFAAAGLIAALGSTAWAFYIDAATFLLSGVCIATAKITSQAAPVEAQPGAAAILSELRDGISYMAQRPELRSLLLLRVPVVLSFGLTNALLLPFTLRALGASEFEYGLIEGIASIGILVGGLLMAHVAHRMQEGQWIAVGLLIMAVEQVLTVQLGAVPLAMVLLFIGGVANAPVMVATRLLIQRVAASELRGRVASAYYVITNVGLSVGMLGASLADLIDVRLLFLLGALPLFLSGLLALVLPGLRVPAHTWLRSLGLASSLPQAPQVEPEAGEVATA
ncbi:MAG: MFS transporter [Chloroflexales bacterium]|nr:MFS transporter [Chloroflexales bacterium]